MHYFLSLRQTLSVFVLRCIPVGSTRFDATPHWAAHSDSRLERTPGFAGKARGGDTGLSPLRIAVIKSKMEVVSLLGELGADVNARRNDGMTPLHYCHAQLTSVISERLTF